MGFRLTLLAALALLAPSTHTRAAVRVIVGPTPIPGGSARAAGDITIVNEHLAFALAVASPVPYGVPRGALVDLAPVRAGKIGHDRVVFADFIPNNWSAWPNTYQKVEVLERGPQEARVRAVRDWGKVRIETLYSLAAGSDRVSISTTMTNEGAEPLKDLLSGLTMWPSSGFRFAVPGLAGVTEGAAEGALARRVTAYDVDWTVTLHAPYLDHVGSGSRDMFQLHTLKPGESRRFSGWLQVGTRGDLAPVVAAEIEQQQLPSGSVTGRVSARDGRPLARPVLVVQKDGKPYAWTLGHAGRYTMRLPAGDYSAYATGPDFSRSPAVALRIAPGSRQTHDFGGLEPPGRVEFSVRDARTRAPLDARITIAAGERAPVEFLGRKTFFTALSPKGRLRASIAPGRYRFEIAAGGGVLAQPVQCEVEVLRGATAHCNAEVRMVFDPVSRGWFSADLHHHADQAEAVTPPADLARSQLAAGLSVLFVSDHDSTVNHAALRRIAATRGVPFIAGIELSPSWGHFNAYPLKPGARLTIDTGTASVGEVFKEARRMGAGVVQVNHPFIPYGYFSSVAKGVAPGGFDGSFDLVEVNSTVPEDDPKVLARLWSLWNEGKHYYLTAGSDTHDVWNEQSGRVRTFVHVEGTVTADAFSAALKAGHAYVSYGPLIYPGVMFGSELRVSPGTPSILPFVIGSVAGLKQVELVADGKVRETRAFTAPGPSENVDFSLTVQAPGWFALIVEDQAGHKAYTDPIWVATAGSAPRP